MAHPKSVEKFETTCFYVILINQGELPDRDSNVDVDNISMDFL